MGNVGGQWGVVKGGGVAGGDQGRGVAGGEYLSVANLILRRSFINPGVCIFSQLSFLFSIFFRGHFLWLDPRFCCVFFLTSFKYHCFATQKNATGIHSGTIVISSYLQDISHCDNDVFILLFTLFCIIFPTRTSFLQKLSLVYFLLCLHFNVCIFHTLCVGSCA